MKSSSIFGVIAEFDAPEEILEAAKKAKEVGYKNIDAYTPFPMEELTVALGVKQSKLSLFVLCCGIAGGLTGFFLPYFAAVIDYPLNIGGRPLNSWPYWIPITFELTILFAAIGAVVGMIFRNGLPRPVHPLFNVDRFERVTQDKFFLCIESTDPKFDHKETERFLRSLNPAFITTVDAVERR